MLRFSLLFPYFLLKKMNLFFLGSGAVVLLFGVLWHGKIEEKIAIWETEKEKEKIEEITPQKAVDTPERVEIPSLSPRENFVAHLPESLPNEVLLDVPFVCQNPFQNEAGWKDHKESCEEAAALQTALFWRGEVQTPQESHEEILEMVRWEKEYFGEARPDLYRDDMGKFLRGYFGFLEDEVLLFENIDEDLLKRILAGGFPVILPIMGAELHNPYYPDPGYHMLTAIGFSGQKIITNDVGTKRGEKYPYNVQTLLKANASSGGWVFVIAPKGGQ